MSLLNSLTLFVTLIIIYQFIVSVFTILFRMTGLPHDKARFQVISILTGCGFTTGESELAISSPQRRKVARTIMVFGYAFTVTIMSALVNIFLSFNQSELQIVWWQLTIPLLVLIALKLMGKNPVMQRYFSKNLEDIAVKIMFKNNANRILLLDYIGHQAIAEVNIIQVPEKFKDIPLYESGLRDNYGILVILIEHKGQEATTVHADDVFQDKDRLIVCGDYRNICKAFEADERDFISE